MGDLHRAPRPSTRPLRREEPVDHDDLRATLPSPPRHTLPYGLDLEAVAPTMRRAALDEADFTATQPLAALDSLLPEGPAASRRLAASLSTRVDTEVFTLTPRADTELEAFQVREARGSYWRLAALLVAGFVLGAGGTALSLATLPRLSPVQPATAAAHP